MKKFYRSKNDRMLAGVCGGLAAYTRLDSTIIRIIVIIAVLATGIFPVVIAYILAYFFVKEEPRAGVVEGKVISEK